MTSNVICTAAFKAEVAGRTIRFAPGDKLPHELQQLAINRGQAEERDVAEERVIAVSDAEERQTQAHEGAPAKKAASKPKKGD